MNLKEIVLNPNGSTLLRELHESGELAKLLPALADLDIQDAKSHRHKNNFHHSLQVLDQARELGGSDDLILLTAALIHDIGKKSTRAFDSKGNPTFTNHEHAGARMVKSVLKPFGYSAGEIKLIAELISHHMRAFGFADVDWTDSAVRRFTASISSDEQLARILIIFRADVTTKNAAFKRKIIGGIDLLEERIAAVRMNDELALRRPALNGHELMELFDLKPGRELGTLMKFLNSEEGLLLSREDALAELKLMVG